MDCQTSNDLLLDLAYGELDEVRAAAVRKHMDSCGECREAFARVSRGRSLAKHITRDEAPPVTQSLRAALEAQAARFAEATAAAAAVSASANAVPAGSGGDENRDSNVVPFAPRDGRVSRWFERVGELAMRRQVAMAAVFLIMIGVGLIFYQSHPRPTDAQDDRVPDVVPAVEITPSNGAQANTGRLPTTGAQAMRDRDDHRAANPPAPARPDQQGLRERMQANARSAGSTPSTDPSDLEALAREAEAARAQGQARAESQSAVLAAQAAEPEHQQAQAGVAAYQPQAQGQQVAPPAAHYAQVARQYEAPQPSPATTTPPAAQAPVPQQGVAAAAGRSANATPTNAAANDAIARLQSELAAATDEATRSRIRGQLIVEYERRGMYAEANTLRSQSAEPANAASNSISNSAAGASAGVAQTQLAPAAPSQNFESPTSTGSSTRSTTHRSMRRPAPRRSSSSDSYMDMGL